MDKPFDISALIPVSKEGRITIPSEILEASEILDGEALAAWMEGPGRIILSTQEALWTEWFETHGVGDPKGMDVLKDLDRQEQIEFFGSLPYDLGRD